MCGWEEFIDQGIQEGFVAILKEGYGFISKYFPTEKHPTGIFFHKSDLRGSLITQLKVGDRVHFVVGQNSKGGCVAKKIEVQGQQFAPQVIFFGVGKRRKLKLLFLSFSLALSSSLLKTNEMTTYWSSNNSSHVAITIFSFYCINWGAF